LVAGMTLRHVGQRLLVSPRTSFIFDTGGCSDISSARVW
jgi:hypothetical protein